MIKNIILGIFLSALMLFNNNLFANRNNKNDYKKFLSKHKHAKTVEGFITLHKSKGKVFMEFPKRLLNKEFLFGSITNTISDQRFCNPGYMARNAQIVYFDICANNLIMKRDLSYDKSDDQNINNALTNNAIKAFDQSMKIIAYTPDKLSVLVDATNLFVFNNSKHLSPIDPRSSATLYGKIKTTETIDKSKSRLKDIKVFTDNLIVKSELTYKTSLKTRGKGIKLNITANVGRELVLLSDKKMRPRYADKRIPLNATYKRIYNKNREAKIVYNTYKWNLEPVDIFAHREGKLTDVKKPIIFYVAPNVPKEWVNSITEGICEWNKAFEKIGFKNVLQVKAYPENNPEFDEDNIKFNCIKYAYTSGQGIKANRIVDARTGEILNVNLVIPKNLPMSYHLADMVFLGDLVPEYNKGFGAKGWSTTERIQFKLKQNFAFLTGTTILGYGYLSNASESYDYDNLRDNKFIKENGFTPTLLDPVPYNVAAKIGDYEKGLILDNPAKLGVVDYFITKWVYKPIYHVEKPIEEFKTLDSWIKEHNSDKRFRYYDVTNGARYQMYELGNDPVKLFFNTKARAKRAIKQVHKWFDDKDDYNYNLRYTSFLNNFKKYNESLKYLLTQICRVDLQKTNSTDGKPTVVWQTRHNQKKYIDIYLKELEDYLRGNPWYDNDFLQDKLILRKTKYQQQITSFTVLSCFIEKHLPYFKLSNNKYYSQEEYLNDLIDVLFKTTKQGKKLGYIERYYQKFFFDNLANRADIRHKKGQEFGIADYDQVGDFYLSEFDNEFTNQNLLKPNALSVDLLDSKDPEPISWRTKLFPDIFYDATSSSFFNIIENKVLPLLRAKQNTGTKQDQYHYRYMIYRLERMIQY